MDDSEEAKLNWGENMLGHHCNSPNVDGMPGVEMRIQATMVQQGADVCAEAEAWRVSHSWNQTLEFIQKALVKREQT